MLIDIMLRSVMKFENLVVGNRFFVFYSIFMLSLLRVTLGSSTVQASKVQLINFENRIHSSSRKMVNKSALVFLAEGAEEMEFTISVDILRRAGIDVTVAGVTSSGCIKCSRGVKICPDVSVNDVSDKIFDAVVLPGGLGGSSKMAESSIVGSILNKHESDCRLIAAICAAPTALKAHGIGTGKTITSYPSVKDAVLEGNKYKYSEEKVVVDGNIVTSRGPGTAFDFALAIAEILVGKETRDKVSSGLLYL